MPISPASKDPGKDTSFLLLGRPGERPTRPRLEKSPTAWGDSALDLTGASPGFPCGVRAPLQEEAEWPWPLPSPV